MSIEMISFSENCLSYKELIACLMKNNPMI